MFLRIHAPSLHNCSNDDEYIIETQVGYDTLMHYLYLVVLYFFQTKGKVKHELNDLVLSELDLMNGKCTHKTHQL